jgi:hypothetical protein
MSYSQFTSLIQIQQNFPAIQIRDREYLFRDIDANIQPSELIVQILQEYTAIAIAISTEKARSELIITPILLEVRRQCNDRIGFFSGTDFNVDANLGLTGYCDYILTRSTSIYEIIAPVLTIVEAKNENIKSGLGQCIAEMIAASIFNKSNEIIYGAVTTGTEWKFLTLENNIVKIDLDIYYLDRLEKILKILTLPFI